MEKSNTLNEAVQALREGGVLAVSTPNGPWICCDATNSEAITQSGFTSLDASSKLGSCIIVANFNMLEGYADLVPEAVYQLMEVSDEMIRISYPIVKNLSDLVKNEDGSAIIVHLNPGMIQQIVQRFRKPLLAFESNFADSGQLYAIEIPNPLIFSAHLIQFKKDESFKIIKG